jgi:hypothetical protein
MKWVSSLALGTTMRFAHRIAMNTTQLTLFIVLALLVVVSLQLVAFWLFA